MANGICRCSNPIVVDPGTPCGSPDCLRVPHIVVPEANRILPCGQTLIITLNEKIGLSNKLDSSLAIFEVISHTENLTDVLFTTNADNSSIELSLKSNYSGITSSSPEDYKFGKITYKVIQGFYSGIGTITVPFSNLCIGVSIPSDKVCDPCTGNLLDKTVNISVTGGDTTGQTIANIKIS